MKNQLPQIAASFAASLVALAFASPFSLAQTDNRTPSAVMASAKPSLPPFVTAANRISLVMELDAGAVAKEMGGPVLIVHPVPVPNAYNRFTVSATLDGKPLEVDTTSEKQHRPFFKAYASEQSGKIRIVIDGVQLERTIGLNDKLPANQQLSKLEEAQYTNKYPDASVDAIVNNAEWQQKVKALGLEKTSGESNYDYMVRMAKFLQRQFTYGEVTIPNYAKNPEQMFDSSHLMCDEATQVFLSLAQYAGIPAKGVSGIVLDSTKMLGYHREMEFYDPEKGYIECDGAAILSGGRNQNILSTFGRSRSEFNYKAQGIFIPMSDSSHLSVFIPGFTNLSRGFGSQFVAIRSDLKRGWKAGWLNKVACTTTITPISLDKAAELAGASFAATIPQSPAVSRVATGAWATFNFEGGQGAVSTTPEGATQINPTVAGANPWSNQAFVTSNRLVDGAWVDVTFNAKADRPRKMRVLAEQNEAPYAATGLEPRDVSLTTEYQPFTFRYFAKNATGKSVKVVTLHLGKGMGSGAVYVKDLKVEKGAVGN